MLSNKCRNQIVSQKRKIRKSINPLKEIRIQIILRKGKNSLKKENDCLVYLNIYDKK